VDFSIILKAKKVRHINKRIKLIEITNKPFQVKKTVSPSIADLKRWTGYVKGLNHDKIRSQSGKTVIGNTKPEIRKKGNSNAFIITLLFRDRAKKHERKRDMEKRLIRSIIAEMAVFHGS